MFKNGFLLAIITALMAFSLTSHSHECMPKKDQVSFHFKNSSIVSVLYYISQYSDKDLIIKTPRIPSGRAHYNCMEWQSIVKDLEVQYDVKIDVTETTIVLREP